MNPLQETQAVKAEKTRNLKNARELADNCLDILSGEECSPYDEGAYVLEEQAMVALQDRLNLIIAYIDDVRG